MSNSEKDAANGLILHDTSLSNILEDAKVSGARFTYVAVVPIPGLGDEGIHITCSPENYERLKLAINLRDLEKSLNVKITSSFLPKK